jgi:hypothetical protein
LRLPVSLAMPLGQGIDCRLALPASIQPSRAFGDPKGEETDQDGEEHLEPHREQPRSVALDVQAATRDAG